MKIERERVESRLSSLSRKAPLKIAPRERVETINNSAFHSKMPLHVGGIDLIDLNLRRRGLPAVDGAWASDQR